MPAAKVETIETNETKSYPNHQLLCIEGDMHFFGHGVPKDISAATYYYAWAMNAGSKWALLALAHIFEDGNEIQ